MRSMTWLVWPALLLLGGGAVRAQEPARTPSTAAPAQAVKPPAQISAAVLRDHVTTLASDEFKGRDTKSGGIELAAEYLAGAMKRTGLEPAGDEESYFHSFTLGTLSSPPENQTLSTGDSMETVTPADGWMALDPCHGTWRNTLVWGGGGDEADFADLPDGALEGRILVVQADGAMYEPSAPASMRAVAAWAGKRGVAAVVAIAGRETPPGLWSRFALRRGGRRTGLREDIVRADSEKTPIVWCEQRCLEKLLGPKFASAASGTAIGSPILQPSNDAIEPRPIELALNAVTTFASPVRYRNLVGRIPGSDPKLRDEVVLLTAHYDHIGINPNPNLPDRIYNGADDDASGTGAIMAMGAAFAAAPPKRTVLVVAFTAEEKGLLGSKQFVKRPVVPLKQIVAVVNVEMVGRPAAEGPGKIWITGYTRSSFGPIFTLAAAPAGVTAINDPYAMMGFFKRSDNYSFALAGIPAHTCSSFNARGARHYHQVTDHAEDCDFDNMATLVHGIYLGARTIAMGAATPQWVKGDPLAKKR